MKSKAIKRPEGALTDREKLNLLMPLLEQLATRLEDVLVTCKEEGLTFPEEERILASVRAKLENLGGDDNT